MYGEVEGLWVWSQHLSVDSWMYGEFELHCIESPFQCGYLDVW